MDYTDILRKSWEITWRHKILWIFGFFAGAASYSGGSNGFSNRSNLGSNFGSGSTTPFDVDRVRETVMPYLALAIAVIAFMVLLGIVFWVLSIAARGGLVYLGNEAAAGREVHAGPGWAQGFGKWGRTFLIGFLLSLPIWIILIVALLPVTLALIGAALRGGDMGAAIVPAITGSCCLLGVAIVLLIPYSLLVSVLYPLALRHGVLQDVHSTASIAMAWRDLRGRFKDVGLTWLILLGISIGYGFAIGIVALFLFIPVGLLVFSGGWVPAIFFGFLAVLLLMLPGAVYATFHNNVWTVFFRRFTGEERVAAAPEAPAPGSPYLPPPPPAGPQYAPPEAPPLPPYPSPAPPADA